MRLMSTIMLLFNDEWILFRLILFVIIVIVVVVVVVTFTRGFVLLLVGFSYRHHF